MSIIFVLVGIIIGSLLFISIFYFRKYHKVLNQLKQVTIERDIDELTGVYNRTGFSRIARKVYDSHKRDRKTRVSFAYIDLDAFKLINDSKGHEFGDCVLKIFAVILTNTVRETDVVGRQGGDEFVILFTNSDDTQSFTIEDLLARMRTKFEEKVDELYATYNETRPTSVSVSFGIAQHTANRFNTLEELIIEADKSLYRNKALRGRCKILS